MMSQEKKKESKGSAEQFIKSKNGKIVVGVSSVALIIVLLFAFVPDLRSIFQPKAVSTGYGYVRFYDPTNRTYIGGTYDLVKSNNVSDYYARGVENGTVMFVSEPCIIVFNGTSLSQNFTYEWFPESVGFEAKESSLTPVENIITLRRRATPSEVNMTIINYNGVYGNYKPVDIQNKNSLTIQIEILNLNLTKRIGYQAWLPPMLLNQSSIDTGLLGWSLWLGFIGDNNTINSTVVQIEGLNCTVFSMNNISVLQLHTEHAEKYYQTFVIPQTLGISQIVLYDGEIADIWDPYHRLEVIV
jgi:hypothetical protein